MPCKYDSLSVISKSGMSCVYRVSNSFGAVFLASAFLVVVFLALVVDSFLTAIVYPL